MWDSTLLRGAVRCGATLCRAVVDYCIVSAALLAVTAGICVNCIFLSMRVADIYEERRLRTNDQSADALFVVLEGGTQEGFGRLVAKYLNRVSSGFFKA